MQAPPARDARCCLLIVVNIIDQTLGCDDPLHELRKSLSLEGGSLCYVCDDTGIKINLHLIPCFDSSAGLGTFDDGKSYIDGVSIKDPGKGLGDDAADAGGFDGYGCMLPG